MFALQMMAAGLVLPASLPASSRTVAPRAHAPSMDLFGGLKQAMYKTMAGNYDEAEVRGRLERQIKMKPCVMYADSSCPFCQQAQKALTSMGAVYSVIELDSEDDGMAMKAELIAITGQSSVPQVFVGGTFIGGCNDGGIGGVLPLHKSGKLEELLIGAGALCKGARI